MATSLPAAGCDTFAAMGAPSPGVQARNCALELAECDEADLGRSSQVILDPIEQSAGWGQSSCLA
jgi:hypothetical protein